jgi:hypothetical protein
MSARSHPANPEDATPTDSAQPGREEEEMNNSAPGLTPSRLIDNAYASPPAPALPMACVSCCPPALLAPYPGRPLEHYYTSQPPTSTS